MLKIYMLFSIFVLVFLIFFCAILQKSLFLGFIDHKFYKVIVNDVQLLDIFSLLFYLVDDEFTNLAIDNFNNNLSYKCFPYATGKYLFYCTQIENIIPGNGFFSLNNVKLLYNMSDNLFFNDINFFRINGFNHSVVFCYENFIKSAIFNLVTSFLKKDYMLLPESFFLEKKEKNIMQLIRDRLGIFFIENKRLVFINSLPNEYYTVQLASASQFVTLYEYAKKNKLNNYLVYKTIRNGRFWYVLISGVYLSKFQANLVVNSFPVQQISSNIYEKPLIRSIESVKLDLHD